MPFHVSCIAFHYNMWLVFVATCVCATGSWALLGLFQRAALSSGKQRLGWQVIAATSAGASIWSTHFLGMLAYEPGVPVGFDPLLTIGSGLAASLGAFVAFVVASAGRWKGQALLGGALLGAAISAMHYTGMLAYRIEGLVGYSVPVLIASIVLAVVCAAGSLHFAVHGKPKRRRAAGVAWLVAATVGLHFTGMEALRITPLEVAVSASNGVAIAALAFAIVGITVLIVGAGVVTYLIDQDLRADASRRMSVMAMHDGLTGLPNRAHFRQHLERLIDNAAQTSARVALVAIDVNEFKEINDQFGHATGDAVLRRISHRLRNVLRDGEFGARLGGDEFAVVQSAPGGARLDDLIARLSRVFADDVEAELFRGHVGASLGVAVFPEDADDAEGLVNNAVLALYRAKADHSAKVYYYERAMDERVRERRKIAAELRSAIAHNQLEVHYQVQRAVEGGAIQGFEALARWPRGADGYLPPSEFIPVAEECGLIEELGHWVLKRACTDAARWDPPYKVAVNLSPLQLMRANLLQTIASVLQETGLDPSRLELEITELAIIRDAKTALRAMRQIRELGATLALDDFGTGYSSLATLRNFPFDKIKLDRSFLRDIETSPQAKAVLRAVLALGEGLGIPVLTEGVETQGQLEMLRAKGCSQAQGYLLGRPVPLSVLTASGIVALKPPRGAVGDVFAAA